MYLAKVSFRVLKKPTRKKEVATVKKLILEFNLTKGDIRGKAMKQLEG